MISWATFSARGPSAPQRANGTMQRLGGPEIRPTANTACRWWTNHVVRLQASVHDTMRCLNALFLGDNRTNEWQPKLCGVSRVSTVSRAEALGCSQAQAMQQCSKAHPKQAAVLACECHLIGRSCDGCQL